MKNKTAILIALILVLLAILNTACAGSEEAVNVDEITVTFEPENCLYDGPEVIRQGELTVIFNNLTDSNGTLRIYKLENGKNWQDFVDHYSEKNIGISFPSWATIQSHKPNIEDPRVMNFSLGPGLYAMQCGEWLEGTFAVWLGSSLEVK